MQFLDSVADDENKKPVSSMIIKSRLRWFGHVERQDDNDWVRRCITWEVEGIKRRTPEKDPVGLC